jgi:hypothetical protein
MAGTNPYNNFGKNNPTGARDTDRSGSTGFEEFAQSVPILGDLYGSVFGYDTPPPAGVENERGAYGQLKNIDPGNWQKQPDGTWYSPELNQYFTGDPFGPGGTAGVKEIQNPNVATQVATNAKRSQDFLGRIKQDDAEHGQIFGDQTGLVKSLQGSINGTAPSVAQNMLGQATDSMNRNQLAGASGIGGQNAFAARRQAMQNIALGQARENQSKSLLRAQEIADSQRTLAGTLGTMGNSTDRRTQTNVGAATNFSEQAAKGQSGLENLAYGSAAKDKEDSQKRGAGGLDFLGSLLG